MKLNLSKLKEALIIEGDDDDYINDWVKENIGDGDVSVREWLDKFGEYWSECSDDYGDSEEIINILVNSYKLSDSEIDEVMMMYWECESIEEYKKDYNSTSYSEYKIE